MNTLILLSGGFVWGGILSCIHFGGLWLSLTHMPRMARPALWFYGGLLVRYGITLAGMWLALKIGPETVMASCAGLFGMRMVLVTRLSGTRE